jgi:hypothetical protein
VEFGFGEDLSSYVAPDFTAWLALSFDIGKAREASPLTSPRAAPPQRRRRVVQLPGPVAAGRAPTTQRRAARGATSRFVVGALAAPRCTLASFGKRELLERGPVSCVPTAPRSAVQAAGAERR